MAYHILILILEATQKPDQINHAYTVSLHINKRKKKLTFSHKKKGEKYLLTKYEVKKFLNSHSNILKCKHISPKEKSYFQILPFHKVSLNFMTYRIYSTSLILFSFEIKICILGIDSSSFNMYGIINQLPKESRMNEATLYKYKSQGSPIKLVSQYKRYFRHSLFAMFIVLISFK